jgi:hypothetical protein
MAPWDPRRYAFSDLPAHEQLRGRPNRIEQPDRYVNRSFGEEAVRRSHSHVLRSRAEERPRGVVTKS